MKGSSWIKSWKSYLYKLRFGGHVSHAVNLKELLETWNASFQ